MKKTFGAVLGALALAASLGIAAATPAAAPGELVQRVVEATVKAAKAGPAAGAGATDPQLAVLRREFLPYTDFERTARLTMGVAWAQATPEQRARVVQQFTELLLQTYALQLAQIQGQPGTDIHFSFEPAQVDAGGKDAIVRATVEGLALAETPQIAYRLSRTPAGWRIYDIDIMGMWLIPLYQRPFAQQVARGGIDGLINYLAEHNARAGG